MAAKKKPTKLKALRRCWRRVLKTDNLELKDVDMAEQTEFSFPGRRWADLSVTEQAQMFRTALRPDNCLVDPHCDYMKVWDMLITACLIFVGVVTPYEVIFIGPLDWEHWLFFVNRFVDIIFIKDMIIQFFLKVQMFDHGRKGRVLIKDPQVLRWRYLTTWFPIDFISVFQFDLFFMLVEDATNVAAVAPIKFLRMIRLLRLVKLLRILRTSRLINRWKNYFNISFAAQKLIKLIIGLLICSHWMACLWGLLGYSLGRELCDGSNRVEYTAPLEAGDVSWLMVLFSDDRLTPDDPCNSWHVYTAALHWSVLTITSIGYGDIVPTRNAEYWAGVCCMLLGGVVWATVIGGMCAVIGKGDPVQENFETNTDLLNSMMEENGTPRNMHAMYREYLREAKVHDTADHFRKLAQQFSPDLRGKLLLQVSRQWIEKVPYLTRASERCSMHLVDGLNLRFFGRREILDIASENLCITDRGTVARDGQIVTPGCFFHVDFIVCNPKLRKLQETVSLTYCLILTLDRLDFFEIIEGQPELKAEAKRMAIAYAMTRCVKLCVEEHRKERGETRSAAPLSFTDAFDRLQIDATQYTYATRGAENAYTRIVKMSNTMSESSTQREHRSQRSSNLEKSKALLPGLAETLDKRPMQKVVKSSPPPAQPAPRPSRGIPEAPEGPPPDELGERLDMLENTVELVLEEIRRVRAQRRAEQQGDTMSKVFV